MDKKLIAYAKDMDLVVHKTNGRHSTKWKSFSLQNRYQKYCRLRIIFRFLQRLTNRPFSNFSQTGNDISPTKR